MRKLFLLGTMLGVAGTALAFGGMFGGGHGGKSTTYKGGVDAIGVHFGGETSESVPEEVCPADKKCGNGCCQLDNVCQQDPDSGEYQCCKADGSQCCPEGQNPAVTYGHSPLCCNDTLFAAFVDSEGNKAVWNGIDENYCCKDGKIYLNQYFAPNASYPYKVWNQGCCSNNKKLSCVDFDENGKCLLHSCCENDEIPYCTNRNSDGTCNYHSCCPVNTRPMCISPFGTENCGCCADGEKPYLRFQGYYIQCCPGNVECSSYDGSGNCTQYTCNTSS